MKLQNVIAFQRSPHSLRWVSPASCAVSWHTDRSTLRDSRRRCFHRPLRNAEDHPPVPAGNPAVQGPCTCAKLSARRSRQRVEIQIILPV